MSKAKSIWEEKKKTKQDIQLKYPPPPKKKAVLTQVLFSQCAGRTGTQNRLLDKSLREMEYNISPLDKEFIILLLLTFPMHHVFASIYITHNAFGYTEKSGPDYSVYASC